VQDDLQDKSTFRRGQRSVASGFGDAIALGLTDRLITASFVCLSHISCPENLGALIRRVNYAVAKTADGQASELCGNPLELSVDSRLLASTNKSGPLFALALELPLVLANYEEYLETAHSAACQFGLGYQIWDDLKDQNEDAESDLNGNLVLAMGADSDNRSAAVEAAHLARKFLQNAANEAARLPCDAGRPLIALVDQLLPKLHAHC
jgi:geranylgeranyl diphosphate synthase type II